jgi:cell division protein ZapA (FtsZ GTPase activity inhibitor)
MNKEFILKVAGIAAAACLLLCEPVPHNAINDARAVLEKADKSGGQVWSPTQLKKGHAFYDSAMKELSVEKRKLPFNRNYKKTIDLLDLATVAGHYVLDCVNAANERMRADSRELLDRAKGLADSLDNVLKEAAAHKKNVGLLQAALDSARMAREEALAVLNNGNLFLAEEKAISASNKTEDVVKRTAELLSPPQKSRGRRK